MLRCVSDAPPGGAGGQTAVDHIRLFPIREGVRWTYRVHEQILPSLERLNIPIRWTDIKVRHTGYANRDVRAAASSTATPAFCGPSLKSGRTILLFCSISA